MKCGDTRRRKVFTTRGHHTYTRCKSQNGNHAARTLKATQFKTPSNFAQPYLVTKVVAGGELGLQAFF
jgi:hypothetical protein